MQKEINLDSFGELLKSRILAGENPTDLRKWVRKERGIGKSAANDYYKKVDEGISKKERAKIPPIVQIVDIQGVMNEGFVADGDSGIATAKVRTFEELVAATEVDLEIWAATKISVSSYKGEFSVKGEFKRRVEEINLEKIKEEIKEELQKVSPKVARIKYPEVKDEKLLIVATFDVHLGKRTVNQDPGKSSLEVTKELFKSTIIELVERSLKFSSFSRILFPISQDYLHFDSSRTVTYNNTPQDTDMSFALMFKEGRRLLVWAINYLKQFAPVDVVYTPSNHDRDSMFQMADAIECWFHNDENVTVDNSEDPRKYYLYGDDIVIGICHGDKASKRLPALASIECPEWSSRKHRELIRGHFHKEDCFVIEEAGCIMRTIPSLSGKDRWHWEEGFLGAKQRSQAFIWGKNSGLNTIIYSTAVN